jgi:DNA-binding GntR family transcriptional regulator
MDSQLAVLAEGDSNRGHRTLAEKAFETLHSAIITGQLRPGTRLPIEELADVLEMSPMPIREAVRRLDGAGLVENIPHRGARVTELSVTDLSEVYEARLALEVLAIRRAAERFDAAHEAAAAQRLATLNHMTDDNSATTSVAHEAFHFALYDAADSAWLLRLIRPVWETSERYCLEVPQCRQLAARVPATILTARRSHCTTTWPRRPTTSRSRWAASRCSSSGSRSRRSGRAAGGRVLKDPSLWARFQHGPLKAAECGGEPGQFGDRVSIAALVAGRVTRYRPAVGVTESAIGGAS